MAAAPKPKTVYRFTATVSDKMYQHVTYWAEKKGISINELLRNAISLYIAYENKDYDLPALEITVARKSAD